MIWTKENWPRGRWPNFSFDELACTHSGLNEMRIDTMDRLQKVRTRYGRPVHLTSGYRDVTHPREAVKRDPEGNIRGGPHSTGRAIDVAVRGVEAVHLLTLALEVGFTGIGVDQRGDGRFLHLDDLQPEDDFHVPRPWLWSY